MAPITVGGHVWRSLFAETVAHYIALGHDLRSARELAEITMQSAFLIDEEEATLANAKDLAEGDSFR